MKQPKNIKFIQEMEKDSYCKKLEESMRCFSEPVSSAWKHIDVRAKMYESYRQHVLFEIMKEYYRSCSVKSETTKNHTDPNTAHKYFDESF